MMWWIRPIIWPAYVSDPVVRVLQHLEVEALHLHHGCLGPTGLLGGRVTEEAHEQGRDDLPREAEGVHEPAALALLTAAVDQRVGDLVDLLLRLDADEQRERVGELVHGPAVHQRQRLSLQADGRDEQGAVGQAALLYELG